MCVKSRLRSRGPLGKEDLQGAAAMIEIDVDSLKPTVVIVNGASQEKRAPTKPSSRWWSFLRSLVFRAAPASAPPSIIIHLPNGGGPLNLNQAEQEDLKRLLEELAECPIPQRDPDPTVRDERQMFILAPEEWDRAFRHLRAIWSPQEKVVILYAWGFGQSFLQWAVTFQPALYGVLKDHSNHIVVVVPAITRMTADLHRALNEMRDVIWRAS